MRRLSHKFLPGTAFTVACLATFLPGDCRGDAINPWQGATVSVSAAGKNASNSGATASASTSGNTSANSLGSFGQPVTIGYSGSASANATGNANQLLSLSTSLSQGVTGVLTAPINPSYPVSADASWNNDSLMVQGPAGAPLPGSVTLQLRIDVSPIASLQLGTGTNLAVQINGENHALTTNGDGTITMQPPALSGAQSSSQTATFDIKLGLNAAGVSDPFSVGLSSSQAVQPVTIPVNLPPSSLALSLTGVTLPDGSPLSAGGYSVTFASGLTLAPQAVPEPATLAIWVSIAAIAVTSRLRASATRVRQCSHTKSVACTQSGEIPIALHTAKQ